MNEGLRRAFHGELSAAGCAEGDGELARAWRRRAGRELLGQLPRLLLAAPGSWTGRAPLGNTGGADVGIFAPMETPADLAALLSEPSTSSGRPGGTNSVP